MVVDERDLVQYFSKCPCCSNAVVLRGVGRPLRAADGEVGAGEHRPERAREHVVGGERVERLRLGRRQRPDAAPLALVLAERRRVDLDRLGRLEPALEAVEPGGDQRRRAPGTGCRWRRPP